MITPIKVDNCALPVHRSIRRNNTETITATSAYGSPRSNTSKSVR